MPAYASMLGHNVTDMGLVRERATMAKERGFTAQKWFFRHGPMSGHEGLMKNVEMVKTLRETVGPEIDIMLDCWQSMDVNYVVKLASYIEEYQPRWIEEVAMPDRIDSYRKIREKVNIPVSGAEHEYTRWGFNWAGGLSSSKSSWMPKHGLVRRHHPAEMTSTGPAATFQKSATQDLRNRRTAVRPDRNHGMKHPRASRHQGKLCAFTPGHSKCLDSSMAWSVKAARSHQNHVRICRLRTHPRQCSCPRSTQPSIRRSNAASNIRRARVPLRQEQRPDPHTTAT